MTNGSSAGWGFFVIVSLVGIVAFLVNCYRDRLPKHYYSNYDDEV